jgi:hypothetical protein
VLLFSLGSPAEARRPVIPSETRRPGAARIVAIGDLHGDLTACRRALVLAGAIDDKDRWIGGAMVVVQTGDVMDRGDDEPDILELFERLRTEATKAGGRVITLNGNHELMNVAGDFRYVTADGMKDYGGPAGRKLAMGPGSPLARALSRQPIYAIVGDALFVHGGILPAHVAVGLDVLDEEARAWLRGERADQPRALTDSDGPLWTRRYGNSDSVAACDAAKHVLDELGLRRMVVAHTPQDGGANAICDGRVWRIDVGLARAYGGPLQVLELTPDGARVLR